MPLATSVQAEGLRDIDAYAAAHGLDLALHLGFDGFASFPIDRDGHPVFAGFAPPRDGFWLAVTLDGQPFATYAAMPMDLVTNLTEHLVVDGLYHGTDRWSVVTEEGRAITDAVTGVCMFGGGIVVDLPRRGSPESKLMVTLLPLAGRVLGNALYGAEHFVYFQTTGRKLVGRTDRQRLAEGAIRWTRDGHDLGPRTLGYASWAHVLRSLDAFRATAPTP